MKLPKPKTEEPEDFEVWDENWETVQMFLRAQTQWNVSMDGLLERLQVMEATALTELRKRSNGRSN